MEIKINVAKKHFYFFSVLVVLVGGILLVQGQGVNNFGHDSSSIDVDIGGTIYTLQEAVDGGLLGSGSSGSLWIQTGDDIYYSGGNVGVGKNNPSVALDVVGKIKASSGQKVYEITNQYCEGQKHLTTETKCDSLECYDPNFGIYGFYSCTGTCLTYSNGERCSNTLLGRIVESG